ncbi:hypothetical protein HPP92_017902 [Vanilla planifolia]|uniref:Uncharacterized protein n=1 Tax=Vanilla planifolia TaxID=51239 RepID=A0A835QBS5_VANPL|nr:hypothetical protein HPP92_017902 [Vanilla planifolia]
MSQISHGHSGIPDRGGINVGNPGFGNSINVVGGSIPGGSSSSTTTANRNTVLGMGSIHLWGNLGPPISSSAGSISAGGNDGRSLSSAGLNIPSLASRGNLGASASGALNIQGLIG